MIHRNNLYSIVFQSSLARSTYLSLFWFFRFYSGSTGRAKSTIQQVLFLWWVSLGLVVWSRLVDLFISLNLGELWVSHSLGWILGYTYSRFLHCQLLFSFTVPYGLLSSPRRVLSYTVFFFAKLVHLLILWLIISSLLPHNQHLLFCCVLSILLWFLWRSFVLPINEI